VRNARFSNARKNSFLWNPRVMFRFRSERSNSRDAAKLSSASVASVASAQRMSSDSMETCRSNSCTGIFKHRARFYDQLTHHPARLPLEKFIHSMHSFFFVSGIVWPICPGAGDRAWTQGWDALDENWAPFRKNRNRRGSRRLPGD